MKPAHRIAQRMDFALLRPVNDADRHELDLFSSGREGEQLLRLDFEVRCREWNSYQRFELHETKAALRVREVSAGKARKFFAHPTIHDAAHTRHLLRVAHPIADD